MTLTSTTRPLLAKGRDENNVGQLATFSQVNNVVAYFLACLTHFRLKGNICLTANVVMLLGDKQARRDVYTMVYAIVYLLATKIVPITLLGLLASQINQTMKLDLILLLKSCFHPCKGLQHCNNCLSE